MKTLLTRLISMVFIFSISISIGQAENIKYDINLEEISTALNKIEANIDTEQSLLPNLDNYLEKLPNYATQAEQCITTASGELARVDEDIKKLGEVTNDEPLDVVLTRKSMDTKKETASSQLSSCKALLVRSDSALKNISLFRKKNLERKSFDQGPNIFVVLRNILSTPDFSESKVENILESSRGINLLNDGQQVMLISILIVMLAIGYYIRSLLSRWDRKSLTRWQHQYLDEADTGTRLIASLLVTARRYVIPVLLTTSFATFMTIETYDLIPVPLITNITYNLPLLILAFALIYFSFVALPALGLRESVDTKILMSLRIRLAILASVIYVGNLLFQSILTNSLTEETFFLARAVLAAILILNVIWVLWLIHNIKGYRLPTPTRILVTLVLVAAFIAELTGYRNLAGYVLKGVVGGLVAFTVFQLLSSLIELFLEEMNTGKSNWQRRLKQSLNLKKNEAIPGFIWIRFAVLGTFWLMFLISLLYAWGVPATDIKLLTSAFTKGFAIGSFDVVPLKIVEAIAVLVALMSLNGWFQRKLSKKFLLNVGIERGARESIATISNYIGIALVLIVSLAVVGMDFSKLAIIAGALSVGIGFGLQNIVNNFVSGLILLFERPIKTGDWIVVGGVEGTVKKINIRSTLIQSFDGADIIVPNSELISGTLTNWELQQNHGRVRVPVGVAYGSDTEKVKALLLQAANDHEDTIKNDYRVAKPRVMFLSFGDSSLNFELRLFIKDIKKRLHVLSDLNFAIDAAFREHGIEIPFPQRDIHILENKPDPAST